MLLQKKTHPNLDSSRLTTGAWGDRVAFAWKPFQFSGDVVHRQGVLCGKPNWERFFFGGSYKYNKTGWCLLLHVFFVFD